MITWMMTKDEDEDDIEMIRCFIAIERYSAVLVPGC